MRKEIIAASMVVSILGTLTLAKMAWKESRKEKDSIIGDRYKALMNAATNQVDKKIIEEIYRTEKELAALGEILFHHRKHRIECEDLCLRESQVVGKFNDLEEQLSEELRIISRGF
jgi:hypothetical protein